MVVWIECGWRDILSGPDGSQDARYEELATKQGEVGHTLLALPTTRMYLDTQSLPASLYIRT